MLITLLVLVAVGGAARGQSGDAEGAFQARVAQERQSRGLTALAHSDELVAVARRHAQRMADAGEAHHNPNLRSEVSGWSLVGENVGEGYGVDEIHEAFMASPTHRDVILHTQLTQVGVGVVTTDGGHLWVVQVYRRPAQAASGASAAPSAPAPPPAPPSTVPPPTTAADEPAPAAEPSAAPVAAPSSTSATVSVQPSAFDATAELAARVAGVEDPRAMRVVGRGLADPVVVLDAGAVAAHVPGAARVAALLLAGAVGMHGVVLRRLGLIA